MDAARLKRARRRMLGYFLGSGVVMAFIYLCLAAAITSVFGVEPTGEVATYILLAAILAGGTYGIIYFGALIAHTVRRVVNRQPIAEIED